MSAALMSGDQRATSSLNSRQTRRRENHGDPPTADGSPLKRAN
jgi:hypothetical protein